MVWNYLKNYTKKSGVRSVVALSLLSLTSGLAAGQSTPTELADLALEDLLSIKIDDGLSGRNTQAPKWSFSYNYKELRSGGYRSGTQDFTFDEVLFSPGEVRTEQNFPVVPTYIYQDVHAFSASYAVSDATSVNVTVPLVSQGTDHISSVPGFADFLLTSKGVGDISVSANHIIRPDDTSVWQFSLGTRLPVGSINETGDTPRGGVGTLGRLPYTMQIGSGTIDFTGSANYSRIIDNFKVGVTAHTTIRTGKNDNDYRLGNNYGAATWVKFVQSHWFQPGVRLNIRAIEKIKGQDNALLVPAAFPYPAGITNPNNYGGTKANLSALLKVCPTTDCKYSITAEHGRPIYQNLNGIQPKDRHATTLSAAVKF